MKTKYKSFIVFAALTLSCTAFAFRGTYYHNIEVWDVTQNIIDIEDLQTRLEPNLSRGIPTLLNAYRYLVGKKRKLQAGEYRVLEHEIDKIFAAPSRFRCKPGEHLYLTDIELKEANNISGFSSGEDILDVYRLSSYHLCAEINQRVDGAKCLAAGVSKFKSIVFKIELDPEVWYTPSPNREYEGNNFVNLDFTGRLSTWYLDTLKAVVGVYNASGIFSDDEARKYANFIERNRFTRFNPMNDLSLANFATRMEQRKFGSLRHEGNDSRSDNLNFQFDLFPSSRTLS